MSLNFEKFEKAISIYRKRQEQINTLKAEQDKARNYISKYVSTFGTTKTDDATCSCVTRTKIEYDIKAIKAKFAKALYSQFIDDVILVEAYNLIPFLKAHGLSIKDFKNECEHIREVKVSDGKLQRLCEQGVIKFEDLQGCYTAEENKTVSIRLK